MKRLALRPYLWGDDPPSNALAGAGPAFTAYDAETGQIVWVGGVAMSAYHGVGDSWLKVLVPGYLDMPRTVKQNLEWIMDRYGLQRVTQTTDDNDLKKRWSEYLGFTFEMLVPGVYSEGKPMAQWAIVRTDKCQPYQ